MTNNLVIVMCLLLSIFIVGFQNASLENDSKNETTMKEEIKTECQFKNDHEASCEECIKKGSHCFWCESTQKCQQYQWNFPHCPLEDVRRTNCWVNWSIVFVIGVAFFAVIVVAMCCFFIYCCVMCNDCCHKLEQAEEARRSKKAAEARIAMQHEQQQKKLERQAQRDSIRQKYGIPMTSPAFERIK